MGLADALADVMLEDRAAGAEAAASRANADASRARGDLAKMEVKTYAAQLDAQMWEKHAKKLHQTLEERTAIASGALIVINAMIKAMESLPADQRHKFRGEVAQLARARMQKLDADEANNPNRISRERMFGALEENKVLHIV